MREDLQSAKEVIRKLVFEFILHTYLESYSLKTHSPM
ncbi:Uncharacterised protein [Legionella oakridgensis]|nr:Uncharacterised protein [Legionella oakridgensis]